MIWSEIDGDGDVTLVLTHGWGATAAMWAPQVEALRDRLRIITWDLRGHGRSPSTDDPEAYSTEIALADLELLVGSDRVVLGGHSLGGQLSLAYTLRHPDQVAGLVLMSTGPGYRDDAARDKWNGTIERQARALETRGMEALPGGDGLHGGLHTSAVTPAQGAARARALAHAIRGYVKQQDASVIDALPTIDAPALVLVGAKDTGFLNAADYFERKLPRATKVVIPDAGHAVNLHQPDAVNEAIWRFCLTVR